MFNTKFSKKITLSLFIVCFIGFTFWLTYTVSWNSGVKEQTQKNHQQLQQFISHLKSKLERFQSLPMLIAKNPQLVEALLQSNSSARIDLVNHFLTDVNQTIGASDTYLMDTTGLTIAASNWEQDRPFIGKNFSFRPYFKDAMQGQLGRYFALGTTSGKRGYYFSYPIVYAAEIIGVITIKMNLSNIEQFWSNRATQFVVLDSLGIIFISTQQDWIYHSLKPLSQTVLNDVMQSQRYAKHHITPLMIKKTKTINNNNQLILFNKSSSNREYLVSQEFMPLAKWNVMILASTKDIKDNQKTALLLLFLFYSILLLIIYLAWQRHKRRAEKEQFQHQYQQQLEQDVAAQTAVLNQEISQHKKTEHRLKETQNELIQTAKLAVLGQMSASISHELNNPLAALRSYAENAQKFLELNKHQRVQDNLERIENLTERMASISAQLKLFARKSSGKLEPTVLERVIEAAIEIIQPQLKDLPIGIFVDQTTIQVLANRVQLEQVFVNLLSNAVDSIKNQSNGQIDVKIKSDTTHTHIQINDNGAGIDEHNLDTLFDPFFTTKQSGMGLGLSISKRIIESFDGNLTANNKQGPGAQFTIKLKNVTP